MFEGHPSWRALLSFYLGGVAGAVVMAVVVGLTSVFVGLVVGVVLVAAVLGFGLVKRMSTTYLVSTQRLYIRRGMLSKREQQTRIDRVQNVNTEQSLRERMLRVGTVDFDTAGTDDSEFQVRRHRQPRRRSSARSTAPSATPPRAADARGADRGVPRRPSRAGARGALARDVDRRAAVLLPGLGARPRAAGRAATWCSRPTGRRGSARSSVSSSAPARPSAPTARRSRSGTCTGTGRSSTARTGPFHDASVRPATAEEVRAWLERTRKPRARLANRRARARAGRGVRARRRRLRPPHVPVRPVGLGQDVLAGVILEQLLAET